MSRVMRTAAAVDYPYSDGRPMAESEHQLVPMLYLLTALRAHFRERADVYVGGDMFVYYEEGNPAAVVAPDVFVVVGAPKRADDPRLSYKLWEEPKGPDFVLEVVSRSTWVTDRDEKPKLYASLGVEEYWLYDPTGERLASRLRGMRLVGGVYHEIAPETRVLDAERRADSLGARTLHSVVLGLDLRVGRDGALRMRDPVTEEELRTYDEEHDARLAAEAARKAAEAARLAAEAARKAAESRAKREAEAWSAEAAAREGAEARVAELESLVRKLRDGRSSQGDG